MPLFARAWWISSRKERVPARLKSGYSCIKVVSCWSDDIGLRVLDEGLMAFENLYVRKVCLGSLAGFRGGHGYGDQLRILSLFDRTSVETTPGSESYEAKANRCR